MKAAREHLVDLFKVVKPAMAGEKTPIVALRHAWFTGTSLRAYNDSVGLGVSAPLKTEFKGGVMGGTVLGLLEHSTAKEAIIQPGGDDKEIVVVVGGSRSRLPMLAPDGMIWVFPETEGDTAFDLDAAFLAALKHVMVSVPSGADSSGVTVCVEEDGLMAMYSSDAKTVSWAKMDKIHESMPERIVLSEVFCDQVLSWCASGDKLEIAEEYARAVTSKDVEVFGKYVEAKELRFDSVIASNVSDSAERVPLPAIMGVALDRVSVLLGGAPGAMVKVSADGDTLKMYARGEAGDINEVVKLKGKHEKFTASFDVAMLRRGVERAQTFLFNEGCFAFFGEGDTGYMVSAG